MRKHYNIPIFISHFGCPNHCVFCNQVKINGKETDTSVEEIRETLESYLKTLPKKSDKEVAFFGGTFTGLSMDLQKDYLACLQDYLAAGKIQGIRMSTRPDCINAEILDNLEAHGVTAVELGVQSLDAEVLSKSGRNYQAEQVLEAMDLLRERGIEVGVQLMLGLPGSSLEKEVETAKRLLAHKPDVYRIYPTLVIEGTELAEAYRKGEYEALSMEEAIERSRVLACLFEAAGVRLLRLGLQTTEELENGSSLLAGPFHPAFREAVETEIAYVFLREIFDKEGVQKVYASERDISRLTGLKKKNKERFGKDFVLEIRRDLEPGEVEIAGKRYTRMDRIRSNIDVDTAVDFRSLRP